MGAAGPFYYGFELVIPFQFCTGVSLILCGLLSGAALGIYAVWEATKGLFSNNIHGSVHYTIDTIVTVVVVVVYLSAFFTLYCSYTINSYCYSSGNHTPGIRAYSDLVDTCLHPPASSLIQS